MLQVLSVAWTHGRRARVRAVRRGYRGEHVIRGQKSLDPAHQDSSAYPDVVCSGAADPAARPLTERPLMRRPSKTLPAAPNSRRADVVESPRRGRLGLAAALAVPAVLLGAVAVQGLGRGDGAATSAQAGAQVVVAEGVGIAVGDRAPSFEVTTLEGARFAFPTGAPTILTFADLCPTCLADTAKIAALQARTSSPAATRRRRGWPSTRRRSSSGCRRATDSPSRWSRFCSRATDRPPAADRTRRQGSRPLPGSPGRRVVTPPDSSR